MERQHSRRNSTSSIRSQTNSANVDCSEEHTHAIVRREKDKKVVLVPLNNFINFGKTVKVNEIATYKGIIDSRKSDRGKVLLFGTEDLCVEQLEILQEDTIEGEHLPQKPPKKTDLLTTNLNNIDIENHPINKHKKTSNPIQVANKENHAMSNSTGSKRSLKSNEFDHHRSKTVPRQCMNSATNKTPSESSTCQAKRTVQVKRKLFDNSDDENADDTELLSTTKNTLEEGEDSDVQCCSAKSKSKAILLDKSSPRATQSKNLAISRKILTPNDSSNKNRSDSIVTPVNPTSDSSDTSSDEGDISDFVTKEKFNKLKTKLQNQKNKVLALEKKINYYKKNYIRTYGLNHVESLSLHIVYFNGTSEYSHSCI
ncbi:unnamed protein product [Adineta ricciae]|uniref:Uncharacterized protein n=1 Tax=Adineta ricciae TaxID=249248 RepID=A0A816FNI1_ADIRI|nr:unnamed protein product [Adineta ricciae]